MNQRDRIKKLFTDRPGQPVPLPAILETGIAQYGARVLELRRQGMDIRNYGKWENGIHKTWFVYYPHEYQQEMFRSA